MVPDAVLPPAVPFTFQVTAVFEAPLTVAVNCWVPSTGRSAEAGAIETATALLGSGGGGAGAVGAAEPPPHPMPAMETTARKRLQSRKRKGGPSHGRDAEFECSPTSRDAAGRTGGGQGVRVTMASADVNRRTA